MQNWKQLELFDDLPIGPEYYLEHAGVAFIAKPIDVVDSMTCGKCHVKNLDSCYAFACISTERKDKQDVIWVKKYD